MNILYKLSFFVSLLLLTISCNDPDTNPLVAEEDFLRVGLIDSYELVEPATGVLNMNSAAEDAVIIVNVDTTQDVESYTLQGKFFTDPNGNNLELEVDIVTVTEFPATISVTFEELATALGKDISDFTPGNLMKLHGASLSNGIVVDIYTIGSGFQDADAQITGYFAPYQYHNILFIPM